MSNRIRVVFFHIGSNTFGGGSKMLLRLLQSLNTNEFDPILLSNKNDELCKRARSRGIEVTIVPFRGSLDTFNRQLLTTSRLLIPAGLRTLQFNQSVYSTLRKADIIWCKNLRAVVTLFPYLLVSPTPTIWNVGLGLEPTGRVKYLKTLGLQLVDHVFIESEEQENQVFTSQQTRRYQKKFMVFHKGINIDKFDPGQFEKKSDRNHFRIGTAASFTPRKGIEHLIDSLPLILEKKNVVLSIAGEAPDGNKKYEKMLKERARDHGINNQIDFCGWVEDMPEYLSTLDVFVLPSYNEGIPGAVREALAMEVPVVATGVGGTSEVVIPSETGYLVNPGDDEQISEKVIKLLGDQSERRELGKQGRKHIVENFSIESYVKNYERFLKDISGRC